jgi:hypothetical protein
MPDYKNGKIYRITSPQTQQIYIGSTTTILCHRLSQHNINYKRWLKDNSQNYATSYEILKYGDAKIELVEVHSCDNIEVLKAREGHFQRLYKDIVVNIRLEGRTEKEYNKHYHETHKTERKEWRKEYEKQEEVKMRIKQNRLNRIDKYKEEMESWRSNNKYLVKCECGISYQKLSQARHLTIQTHLEFVNPKLKEERLERERVIKEENDKKREEKLHTQIVCCCGGHYIANRKCRHERSDKHTLFLATYKQKFKDLIEKYSNLTF